MSKMTTMEAVLHVLSINKGMSKYALAGRLGRRPIMVDNWLNGTRMGGETADRFEDTFGIEITNAYRPGVKANEAISSSD